MAASRNEAARKRQERRKTLGLGVGRPRNVPAPPALPGPWSEPTQAGSVDLSTVNCEQVAQAKEQQAEQLAQQISERRAAFEGEIAGLVAQQKRLRAEAAAFRKVHLRLADLLGTKRVKPQATEGPRLIDRIAEWCGQQPANTAVTVILLRSVFPDASPKGLGVCLGYLGRRGALRLMPSGIYTTIGAAHAAGDQR